MPAPPYRVIAERKVTDRLLRDNAVWPGNGRPLDGLRWGQRRALARLVAAGVIHEEGAAKYYLDAPMYAARMDRRRTRVAIAMIAVIVGALVATGLLAR